MSPAQKEFIKAATELLEAMGALVPILTRVVEEVQEEPEISENRQVFLQDCLACGQKGGHGGLQCPSMQAYSSTGERCHAKCPAVSDDDGNCPSCGAYRG